MASDVLTMNDLFLNELRDLYDAEKQMVKALPKMIKATYSSELKEAFEHHLIETESQVTRLERIFDRLGEKARGEKCDAMSGLVKEGEKMVDNTDEGYVRDAGLIAAAQRIEHYEMAGYGSARTFAQHVKDAEAASLLQQTLEEEKKADAKLTQLAESMINERASATAGVQNN